jgi:hypothetical protein
MTAGELVDHIDVANNGAGQWGARSHQVFAGAFGEVAVKARPSADRVAARLSTVIAPPLSTIFEG